jgi:hypothetical protein
VAQSGRHVRKSAPAPVPTPEATPLPTPAVEPTPAVRFVVGLDKWSDFSRVPLSSMSGVLSNCTAQLNLSPTVRAEISSRDMARMDAVRLAKAETEAFIVWLQLRSNNFSGQSGPYDDPNNVYIQYTVFAPTTAKPVTSGSTYREAYRNSRVRLPTPTSNGDYYLNMAARGAAQRILDHFHLHVPRTLL